MKPAQKKVSGKRGGAVRDITVKRFTADDNFTVNRIEPRGGSQRDSASVEPLISHHRLNDDTDYSTDNEMEEVEEEVEQVLAQVPQDVAPLDFVNVKFSKFVQLVSSRDCSEVVNANMDENVVISSNLLAELAGTHDGGEEKKIPLVFLIGLAIGVVLTYFLIVK